MAEPSLHISRPLSQQPPLLSLFLLGFHLHVARIAVAAAATIFG